MNNLSALSKKWLELKEEERIASERRREIEDIILTSLNISESLDGTENFNIDGKIKIKVVGRINRKVDASMIQEIAKEHGTTAHLSDLFRWKAEINAVNWKSADEIITKPFLAAVTATPGRPSFSITEE